MDGNARNFAIHLHRLATCPLGAEALVGAGPSIRMDQFFGSGRGCARVPAVSVASLAPGVGGR